MKIAIIAAIAKNRVIGKDGKIPWHISDDLKRFRKLTTDHTILMGRKTFESLGRQLPNRRNVVISSRTIPDVESYRSIFEALEALANEDKIFVIGGGQIYAELLNRADELFLTILDKEVDGDTFFPPYEELVATRFKLTNKEEQDGYTFMDYRKV